MWITTPTHGGKVFYIDKTDYDIALNQIKKAFGFPKETEIELQYAGKIITKGEYKSFVGLAYNSKDSLDAIPRFPKNTKSSNEKVDKKVAEAINFLEKLKLTPEQLEQVFEQLDEKKPQPSPKKFFN